MNFYTRVALSLVVAGCLLGVLMASGGVGLGQILETLSRLSVEVYLAAALLHATTYTLRALRFNLLLPPDQRPSLRRMLVISAAHNMASYILPAKTGEASFILYLRMRSRVRGAEALACLLAARFLDGAVLLGAISLIGLGLALSTEYPALEEFAGIAAGFFALSLFFLGLSVRGDLPVRLVEKLLRAMHVHRFRLGRALLSTVDRVATSLRSKGPRVLGVATLATVAIWMCVFSFFTMLALEMGLPRVFGIPEVALSSGLGSFCNLLPLNGMAGMGTQEIGWVSGLHRLFGVDYESALSIAVGVHCVQIFNVLAAGVLAQFALGVMPRWRELEDEELGGEEFVPEVSAADPRPR